MVWGGHMTFESFLDAQAFFLWSTFISVLVAALADLHLLPSGLRKLNKV